MNSIARISTLAYYTTMIGMLKAKIWGDTYGEVALCGLLGVYNVLAIAEVSIQQGVYFFL